MSDLEIKNSQCHFHDIWFTDKLKQMKGKWVRERKRSDVRLFTLLVNHHRCATLGYFGLRLLIFTENKHSNTPKTQSSTNHCVKPGYILVELNLKGNNCHGVLWLFGKADEWCQWEAAQLCYKTFPSCVGGQTFGVRRKSFVNRTWCGGGGISSIFLWLVFKFQWISRLDELIQILEAQWEEACKCSPELAISNKYLPKSKPHSNKWKSGHQNVITLWLCGTKVRTYVLFYVCRQNYYRT